MTPSPGASTSLAGNVADGLDDPVRREDLEPGRARRDEDRERVRRGRVLLAVGDGSLVAVMAVGDQERRADLDLVAFDRPDARAHAALGDVHRGLARRTLENRIGVVEDEDRLELRLRRAQQAEAALLRAGMGALVWQHLALLVRRRRHRRGEALARARDPVGAGVVLRDPPVARLVRDEHAVAAPGREVGRGPILGVRERQMDDVVRAALEVGDALGRRDDVVRRRDEEIERACDMRLVAERGEGPDGRHSCRLDA